MRAITPDEPCWNFGPRPRQVRLGRTEPVPDAIRLHCSDTGDSWLLGDGDPVAGVSADVNSLYLGLWKRRDLLDNSQIDGSRTQSSGP